MLIPKALLARKAKANHKANFEAWEVGPGRAAPAGDNGHCASVKSLAHCMPLSAVRKSIMHSEEHCEAFDERTLSSRELSLH
jgi:hypothetical protein